MISADDRIVGYVRWQVVSREVLDSVGLMDVPSNSVDVDILIGESDSVARGVGPAALKLLVARLISAGPVPLIALTTSVNNKVAHRAFFKAGFRTMRGYSPPGYGECDLMVFTPAELPR